MTAHQKAAAVAAPREIPVLSLMLFLKSLTLSPVPPPSFLFSFSLYLSGNVPQRCASMGEERDVN